MKSFAAFLAEADEHDLAADKQWKSMHEGRVVNVQGIGHGTNIKVHTDAGTSDIAHLADKVSHSGYNHIRMLTDNEGKHHAWDGHQGWHSTVAQGLGIDHGSRPERIKHEHNVWVDGRNMHYAVDSQHPGVHDLVDKALSRKGYTRAPKGSPYYIDPPGAKTPSSGL